MKWTCVLCPQGSLTKPQGTVLGSGQRERPRLSRAGPGEAGEDSATQTAPRAETLGLWTHLRTG